MTLWLNRRTARERLTYDSGARFEATDLIESKAIMSSFLRGGMQPPTVSDAAWAAMTDDERLATGPGMWLHLTSSSDPGDRETVFHILAFPNMLESYAGMYNHSLLDAGIVKTRVWHEATSFWELGKWWIDAVRSQGDDETIFKDLQTMLEDLAKQSRPKPYEA